MTRGRGKIRGKFSFSFPAMASRRPALRRCFFVNFGITGARSFFTGAGRVTASEIGLCRNRAAISSGRVILSPFAGVRPGDRFPACESPRADCK